VPQIQVMTEHRSARQRGSAIRRVFDVLCSLTGLLLLSPLFCVIALAIKLDDGGAVFFEQERVGRDFRPFRVYKFRTMIPHADLAGFITTAGDSRVTRAGRWLRRYKLDELPQLFNVLKGDMRFVGSRPEVEYYVQMFRSEYAEILQDRPGITDPATLAYRHEEEMLSAGQVEQQYIERILPAKIKLSLAYQKQRSLLSDGRVLLQTVFGLFS
jgi:lipopolysaccharide/colanic/teichoic acid biosynthesis glycosyltransferase